MSDEGQGLWDDNWQITKVYKGEETEVRKTSHRRVVPYFK